MPTYVYACRNCDDRTELVQRMSDPPLTECGQCGGQVRRVLFPPAIVYKGSGFYTTDYKNGGRKSEKGEKSESDGGASGDKSETKTEAKAEARSESKPAEAKSESKPTETKS